MPAAMQNRLAELVGTLRGLVDQAETSWRRLHLPPPTRDAPRPDPDAVAGARTLEAIGRELDSIGGQLRTLPNLDATRLIARHGNAAPARLAEADAAMAAHGEFMLELLSPEHGAPAIEPEHIRRSVAHLRELAQRRAELLA